MDGPRVALNDVFGNWLVVKKQPRWGYWLCRCSCGAEKEVHATNLANGATKGCRSCNLQKLKRNPHNLKHGHKRSLKSTPTYSSWRSMRSRCLYKKATQYDYYGGRGITICQRWLESFENFLSDMGERPIGTTLDRIDSNGNYEKSNCQWATKTEQMQNTRRASKYRELR